MEVFNALIELADNINTVQTSYILTFFFKRKERNDIFFFVWILLKGISKGKRVWLLTSSI